MQSLVIASEAKQSSLSLRGGMDCFVAYAPRNDEQPHSRGAMCVRVMRHSHVPQEKEGAGNAGCTTHPLPRVQTKETHAGQHRYAEITRHSLRNGFTAAPRSPWSTGLVSLHRLSISACRPQGRNRIIGRLDPSVGGSGPHGLTVRAPAARLAADARPSQPAPRIVTTRFAPHAGGMVSLNHNFSISETGIFLRGALDSSGKTDGGFCPRAEATPSPRVRLVLRYQDHRRFEPQMYG